MSRSDNRNRMNRKTDRTGRTSGGRKQADRKPSGGSPAVSERREAAPAKEQDNILAGRNPVMEALKSGREIDRVMIADGAEGSVRKIAGMAGDRGVRVQYVNRSALDRMAGGMAHQGVVAVVSDFRYASVEDILDRAAARGEDPFLIILDGIEDPHNLGAVIRTADAAGAHGVIIPVNRAAAVTAVAEKSAAGAAAYVPVARVTNIARTVDELKKRNIWTAAVDMDGDTYWNASLTGPVAIVIGSEGRGISRLVKEKCDFCVSVPMRGGVNSLNASNAAALLMYEIVRQREAGKTQSGSI